jgi:hypothetical protein
MLIRRAIRAFCAILLLTALAAAETLTGTVTNATTGKPSAGDDVVLLALSQGLNEAGRTRTDSRGSFQLDLPTSGGPYLVRVNHQGVNYFPVGGPLRPGASSVEIQVYDAAKKLEGVSTGVQLMRMQADAGALQVIELISVRNNSKPPRTLMDERTYDVYLPEGAQIDESVVQSPGGMPVNSAPVPSDEKGRYYFVFPLRPGETRFQISYHLPYSGEATFSPKVTSRLEHFAILLPKSMQFTPKVEGIYSPVADESTQGTLLVATGVSPGKDIAFRVSGTGTLAETGGEGQPQAQGGEQRRPGGGLGAPEGTPDPLHKYRWAILGGVAALLALGGFFVVSRSRSAAQPSGTAAAPAGSPVSPAPAAGRPAMLLEALKEELFQLEVDRQQGRISAEEYEKAKAALDQTLQRALSRARSGAPS